MGQRVSWVIAAALLACAHPSHQPEAKTELRAALFPYIPDAGGDQYARLVTFVEEGFEASHPDVDLKLRPISKNDDFYDLNALRTWLATGGGSYDVIEIDTVILGELQNEGLIRPFPADTKTSDWHPAARAAVISNVGPLAIPHLLCGHFVISRIESAATARSVADLKTALSRSESKERDLVGNLLGSWNMPSLYIDAWHDTYPKGDVNSALSVKLDSEAISGLREIKRLCDYEGSNGCLDGTYDDAGEAAAVHLFATGEADSLLGYSERLFLIARETALDEIYVGSAAMGTGNAPVVFVDAFVVRASASDAVRDAAKRFAEFMNRPEIQETLLLSHDAPGAPPRYLLPATLSAFSTPGLTSDRFYSDFKAALDEAVPFPTRGFESIRKSMRDELTLAISSQ